MGALELAARTPHGSQYLGLILSDWVASQALVTPWFHSHPCVFTVPDGAELRSDCVYIDTVRDPPASVAYTFNSSNPGPLATVVWGPHGDGKGGWMGSWDRSTALRRITSPALWLVGGHDLVNPIDVKACAELMPRGSFVEFPAAGHNSFADVPGEWFQAVTHWLTPEVKSVEPFSTNLAEP